MVYGRTTLYVRTAIILLLIFLEDLPYTNKVCSDVKLRMEIDNIS